MTNKNDNTILWVIGIAIFIVLLISGFKIEFFTVSGATMTRTVPSSVQPNQQFTVTYSVLGASGSWGASIVDSVSGGCTFPAGNTLKSVLLSDEGNTKTITIKAPSSGSCTFTGDYQFGTEAIRNFQNSVVTIAISGGGEEITCTTIQTKCEGTTYYTCSNNAWVSQGLVNGQCGYTSGNGTGTGGAGGEGTVSKFDMNKVLFNIGGLEITGWSLIIGVVGLIFLLNLIPRK